ncbi:Outer-membrane lipoprotein lolB precursor [Moraxella cuniculi]|uniref:Outer-membrane lipoprotein LolB n=1 Tax=Moraxella cuniculi TaxID=34061 RepID=A0A448GUL3_9GAMM|nr:lipoprotein insertase outer membrane protein LolB [Moraxella cuniculi]VEG12388.1 Outer-membrane lipoprotein lolB precursor [Moraxella cuniculi]
MNNTTAHDLPVQRPVAITIKKAVLSCGLTALLLGGCATTQGITPSSTPQTADAPIQFAITGKIGIITLTQDGRQSGSAFYAWSQQGERFAMDLTGALGIGATEIRYDGTTATLSSERTGTITADSPEALLYNATGWQAPISQLPYWIVGRISPSDSDSTQDATGRLVRAVNGAWVAEFSYNQTNLPTRLQITHADGHRVTLTIAHQ